MIFVSLYLDKEKLKKVRTLYFFSKEINSNYMELIGYVLLGIVALVWIGAILWGVISTFPYGIIGLIAILGIGFLFAKVIKDRLGNDEDDYYSKNVDK